MSPNCDCFYAIFPGHNLSRLLANLPETAVKGGSVENETIEQSSYSRSTEILWPEDTLMKSLTCLNPKEQKAHDSLQHCKVISSYMPSVQLQEEAVAQDELI